MTKTPEERIETRRASHKAWHIANRDKQNEQSKAWRAKNKERVRTNNKLYNTENQDRSRAWHKEWNNKNSDKVAKKSAIRKALKLNATPLWMNEFFVGEAYSLAALRSKCFGFKWHVDHIVPLQSKLVCGLHNEFNLQVIPAVQNISKGNRTWPGMPC